MIADVRNQNCSMRAKAFTTYTNALEVYRGVVVFDIKGPWHSECGVAMLILNVD